MTLVQHEIKAVYTWTSKITDMRGPCPEGCHVPTHEDWKKVRMIIYNLGLAYDRTSVNTYLKMPNTGLRSQAYGSAVFKDNYGRYWASDSNSSNSAYVINFDSGINWNTGERRAVGLSIRGFKDTTVVPDNNWVTLYDGSGTATGAGIFHNSTLGLISLSSDGEERITMQDKNLGATVVYNSGDTLSQDNCGNYYQWGNNYGFPYTGTVTTSSTLVNAQSYGPGNYYSSNTFIKGSSDWSSVQNDNLRGGVTGVLTEHKIRPSGWKPGANTIAYYPLNGDANDYSGNNRNLTTNGVTYTETIANGNRCGTFTGVIRNNGSKGGEWTSGVSMSNANMTLSVRAKTTGNGTDSTYGANKWMLLYFQDSGRDYGQVIKTAHQTTGYRAIERGVSSNYIRTSSETPTPYADGQWHHFCATYTMSSVKLFVDGQLVASGTGNITAVTTNYNIYVGKDTTSVNYYGYAGQMSEVIYEKATWTDADVLEYYNGTKSNYGL